MRSKKLFDTLHGTGGAASHRGLQGLFARPKKNRPPSCRRGCRPGSLRPCSVWARAVWPVAAEAVRRPGSGGPKRAGESGRRGLYRQPAHRGNQGGGSENREAIARYPGSDLARARDWTDEYLAEHFVAVWAKYYAEYDHAKTFLEDGWLEQDFYLVRDPGTGAWEIADSTSPRASRAP